jgi:hypothetical protein
MLREFGVKGRVGCWHKCLIDEWYDEIMIDNLDRLWDITEKVKQVGQLLNYLDR